MKRSQCKDGLEIYKRFLTRMTRVSEFFKIAEVVCSAHCIMYNSWMLNCVVTKAMKCHFLIYSKWE